METPREDRQLALRALVLVNREEDDRRLHELLDARQLHITYQCRGKGTAPSELMDIFGLSGATRLVTLCLLPKFRVGEVFEALSRQLSLHQRGGGIALTVPVTGVQSVLFHLLKEDVRAEAEEKWEERTARDMADVERKGAYTMIWTSVSSGYSDEVVDAARGAGARGGTVLKGRRRSDERFSDRLGIDLQEEQDFVMIVVPRERKGDVMSAISAACGLNTPAHGVVLSLPVDEALGLER